MTSRIILCLKTAWLAAAVMLLLVGTDSCMSSDGLCFPVGETMISWMIVLSFPAGIPFVIAAAIILEIGGIDYPFDYITFWLTMTCGGYLQWFVILPRVFAKPQFVTLNLKQPSKPAISDTPSAPVRKARKTKWPAAFDRYGRTPLERALLKRS